MKLSIIIVNYNGKEITLDCIESIYSRLQYIDFEIIVVDNASKDGSADTISDEFPEVSLIKNVENLGFSKANNQGIKIAKGDYALLLNNDTLLKDGNFSNLLEYMESKSDVGILGCRITNPDGSLQLSCYKFPSMWEMITHYTFLTRLFPDSRLVGDYRNWLHNEIKKVDFVIGAFFLIKREVIEKIGLLDERFFLNAEEAEYCLRAKKTGWKTVFYPGFKIIHYGGQTKKSMKEKDMLSAIKGTEYLIKKHHNFVYFITFKVLSFILSLIRFGIFGISLLFINKNLNKEIKNKFNQTKMLLAYQLGLVK